MKKTCLSLLCALMIAPFLQAQVQTPQPSPHAKIEQMVGLTRVSIDYSRPGVKERSIFGGLIPYNELWRTGANENTTITFSDDVIINGKTLKKGTYAIFTKPNHDVWQVYFYKDANNWGLPKEWDEKKVALQAEAEVMTLPFSMETFSIMVDALKIDAASLNFVWENTVASLDFQVPTEEKTLKSIETTMNGEPSVNDYFASASYYLSAGKDMQQALQWIEKAEEMTDDVPYYMLRKKSLIEAELGMKKAAIKTAKQSLAAAKKAGNTDYVKMNQASLKEWGAK